MSINQTHDTQGVDPTPWKEWAQMTGWHGVLDFVYAKTILLKILWFTILAIGCFLAINQSYTLLSDFITEDRWITTVTYELPDEGVLEWPNFTLCNLNWLAVSKLEEYDLLDKPFVINYLHNHVDGMEFYQDILSTDNETKFDHQHYDIPTFLPNQSMVNLAQTCTDTMLVCGYSEEFDLEADNSVHNCCLDSVLSEGDSCFKIYPNLIFGNRSRLESSGYKAGIYFLIDARPSDDYENPLYLERPSAGFKISFYYGEDDSDSFNPTVFLGPTRHSVISIAAQRSRTRSRRNNQRGVKFYTETLPCRSETDFVLVNSGIYTQALCQADCIAQYMKDECDCTNQFTNFKITIPKCEFNNCRCNNLFTELNNSSYQKNNTRFGFDYNKCTNTCIEPCDSRSVAAKFSSTGFPAPLKIASLTRYINRALQKNYTEDIVGNYSLLEIYYESNQYQIIEKMERVSVDELISNIGGTLGVWTGISIISICQAFLYIIFGTRSIIEKCFSKPSTTRVTPIRLIKVMPYKN